ncbi:hypothetical protein JCM8097_007761 [Rhodosporidiobolus ruineniae]
MLPAEPPAALTRSPSRSNDLGGRTLVHSSSSAPPPPAADQVLNPHRTVSGPALDDWMKSHPLFARKARGIRLRALRFTSSWFSVTMGTGICNTLLFDLPFSSPHPVFRAIGAAFLIGDMLLFSAFTFLTIARYYLYPKIFWAMIKHETHSLFLGTIPMGFVTIISGIAASGHEYGLNTLDAALVLYWISVGMSILTAFGVPYMMYTSHTNVADKMTAAWLLPIVPLVTEASVGSTFCKLLLEQSPPRTSYCLTILIASYLQVGIGALLASAIIVMYLQRLVLHHLPPREVIVSSWLPVGPIGQAGYALIELGRVSVKLFPMISSATNKPELQLLGPSMLGTAVVIGLMLWGLGIWFAFLAVVSIATQFATVRHTGEGLNTVFNMGWWAFTFPLGSLCLLTFSLATVFDSIFFKVCSAIFTFSVLTLWAVVFIPTSIGFFRGTLFPAPCLQSLPKEYFDRMAPSASASREEINAEGVRGRKGRAGGVAMEEKEKREATDEAMRREADEVLRREEEEVQAELGMHVGGGGGSSSSGREEGLPTASRSRSR